MWRNHDVDADDGTGDIYDSRLVAVTNALEKFKGPGACFTSGVFSHFPLPGLVVGALGDEVRFPLGDRDAKALTASCHLAPYGHGKATIVDTQVRNTWELHADQFTLENPKWSAILDKILTAIRAPLGISETTEYDAQLNKLLLYEPGGMFDKHQDSEKETGMFGTLVVMLPCRFTGGELIVNPPTATGAAPQQEPHVWDAASMNSYDLKYAAFYGDCEHETKPVASGYRLRLETSFQSFFKETDDEHQKTKRQRTSLTQSRMARSLSLGRSEPPPQRDCQLVYVLEHKYTNPGLSFAYLKNKDHLVAQCLAKFCDESNGAFSLYLCKVKYTYEYDPDCDEDELVEKSVQLQSPWMRFGERATVPCQSMTASLGCEIAPAGFFEEVPFDGTENHGYTGNAGSRAEKWYTSAALVVQPLTIELEQTGRAGMDYAVSKWIRMVENESSLAASFASTVFAQECRWTTDDLCFVPCLKAVRRLNNVNVFGDVLHSLSQITFQEAIAATVEHFGWEQCKTMIFEVADASRLTSRVNLVCSVLHGEADPAKIEEVLTRVTVKPTLATPAAARSYSASRYVKAPTNPSGEEYARLLALTFRVSADKLREFLETTDTNALIKLVAPSLLEFANSFSSEQERSADIEEIVRSVVTQLHARMPRASSWDLSHVRLHGGRLCCSHCTELQMFLASPTQQALRSTMNKAPRHHIHKVIDAYCGNCVSHGTDRPSTLVITKLLPDVDLHDVAHGAIQSLRAWLGEPIQVEPSSICGRVPVPRAQEIIEIDSD